jgi:hypothetical protein
MIDLKDFIIKSSIRKDGYVNRCKLFRCACEHCNKDRGYQTKSRHHKKPLCVKCATNTQEHRDRLSNSHWSKNGTKPWNKGQIDPNSALRVKLGVNLRSRLNKAIKGNYKLGSAVKDLGCSINELREYLEVQFQPGMTWNNWSRDGWHIDHIKPLSSFNLTNREELLKAVHYSNLQPLWAKDNLVKSNN